MIAPLRVDRPSRGETPVCYGRRRRPRFGLEAQSGRCPLCNRTMSPYIGRDGPSYHCGCPAPKPARRQPRTECREPQPVCDLPEPALADACTLVGVH